MQRSLLNLAAYNNAIWCNLVCEAHGFCGEFADGLWFSRSGAPAYYPDVITLFGSEFSAQQLLRIRRLIETPRDDARAVKDSFSSLELSGLGFRLLFDAHWIGVNTANSTLARLPPRYSVDPVQTMPELHLWDTVRNGDKVPGSAELEERSFWSPLLARHDVRFVAIRYDGQIVGGGILNLTDTVVGVSNVFIADVEPDLIWRGLLAHARHCFPGRQVVGYESGSDLSNALCVGFQKLGPLRIWQSD
jgi:hypothetical protein